MRVACIRIPSFAVAVERLAASELAERSLAVLDRNTVLDCSPELEGSHGLPARQVKALCPGAAFVEANHALYREVFDAMLDALERVAPLVEPASLGAAYSNVGGLEGHYEGEFALAGALVGAVREETGLLPSAGIADGKFVAWVAASVSPPGDAGVVPSGREREFLQGKSTAYLPCDAEVLRRLDLLALRTLDDVAALPRPAVEAQFSKIGGQLWELANGIDTEPLRPRKPQEVLTERLSFESPVVTAEALIVAARQIVSRLARRLRGRTARRMHLQLLAEERIVWEKLETFREPTRDEGRMTLVLKTRLSLQELPRAVDVITITLIGIGQEVAKQAKLFTDTQQNLNQIAEAIRQLRARYNRPVVYRIAEVNPWSRHPEERRVLLPYDA